MRLIPLICGYFYGFDYDILILEIKTLLKLGEHNIALKKIEEELSMPYIPQSIEKQLHTLLKEVNINFKKTDRLPSIENLINNFLSTDNQEELLAIVKLFENYNLHFLISHIKKFLLRPQFKQIKISLIIFLKKSDYNESISMFWKNKIIIVNIKKILFPGQNKNYITLKKLVGDSFRKEPVKAKALKFLMEQFFWENIFILNHEFNPVLVLEELTKKVINLF